MSPHKNAAQNLNINAANQSFENTVNLDFLRTVTDQNCVEKKGKSRVISKHAYCLSRQNIFFYSHLLLWRIVRIKTHETTILLVVLYKCETWSLALQK